MGRDALASAGRSPGTATIDTRCTPPRQSRRSGEHRLLSRVARADHAWRSDARVSCAPRRGAGRHAWLPALICLEPDGGCGPRRPHLARECRDGGVRSDEHQEAGDIASLRDGLAVDITPFTRSSSSELRRARASIDRPPVAQFPLSLGQSADATLTVSEGEAGSLRDVSGWRLRERVT
jgi:hypothetical protein